MLSHSPNQTQSIAEKFAAKLKSGTVLALTGNLGSGKTHFTKGLAKYFQIQKNITSPTFVLMKVYKTKNKKIKQLVHVDCYRLESPEELLAIGLGEYLENSACLVIIEWAEKIKKILPQNAIWIKFGLGKKENERQIKIEK
jgi:tRNA threonylcarbamoyladenosine biosynthesis protein TsaE